MLIICFRVEITEKIFVHVNMLLSLDIADLVYVLDFTVFTNRVEHPVSSLFIILKPILGLFLWSLTGGRPGRVTFSENCIINCNAKPESFFVIQYLKILTLKTAKIRKTNEQQKKPFLHRLMFSSLHFPDPP